MSILTITVYILTRFTKRHLVAARKHKDVWTIDSGKL